MCFFLPRAAFKSNPYKICVGHSWALTVLCAEPCGGQIGLYWALPQLSPGTFRPTPAERSGKAFGNAFKRETGERKKGRNALRGFVSLGAERHAGQRGQRFSDYPRCLPKFAFERTYKTMKQLLVVLFLV